MTDHQTAPKSRNRSQTSKEPAITTAEDAEQGADRPEVALAEPRSAIESAEHTWKQLLSATVTAASELEAARTAFEARERELADATRDREEAEEAFSVDALPWSAVTEAIDAENRARVLMNTARRALSRASSTKEAVERAAAMGELDWCRELASWEGLLERAAPIAQRVASLTAQLAEAIDALEVLREEQWSAVRRGRELTRELGVEYDLPTKVGERYGRALVRHALANARAVPVLKPWVAPYVVTEGEGAGRIATSPQAIAADAGLTTFVSGTAGKPVSARSASGDLRCVEEGLRGRWREAVTGSGRVSDPADALPPFAPGRDDSLTDGEIVRRYLEWREAEMGGDFERPPLAACDVDRFEVVVSLPGVVFRTPFLVERGEVRFGPPRIAQGSLREHRAESARLGA